MGGTGSRGAPPLQLPQQEVLTIGSPQPRLQGGARRPPYAAPRATAAVAEKLHTGQMKMPFVWEKASLCLERSAKRIWQLSANFTAEVPCKFAAHFHCKKESSKAGLEYIPAAHGGPPSFSESYAPGRHSVTLEGERAIDLVRWPLEVFWKYRKRHANIFPIVFSLTAGNVQSVIHLTLEVPSRKGGQAVEPERKPRCTLLQQTVAIDGKEYVLQEIYGLSELGKDDTHDETAVGEPCVICLTEPRNTAIKPCSHMCICEECAGQLHVGAAIRDDHCPICRGPIEGMQTFDVKGDLSSN